MKEYKIRLQKFMAENGVASRRKSEEMIEAGRVKVNGRPAKLGDKVDPVRDKIVVAGKRIVRIENKVYLMLHKPRGFVTTTSDELGRKCVTDLVDLENVRLYPVGRLDKDSEGLIFLTNDGEFANKLSHPSRHVNKTYRVTVRGKVSAAQIEQLCTGIELDGRKTLPCDVHTIDAKPDRTVLCFIISEGRNRQIRRMCEAVNLEVMRLKRVEIAGVKLGMLPQGKWRELNERELQRLTNVSVSNQEGAEC